MSTIKQMTDLRLSEINLVRTYIAGANAYPMKNGGRAHHGILYTAEGEETYLFSDGAITASPNTVLFIPKNEKYTIEFTGDRSLVTGIDFEADGLDTARPFLSKFSSSSPLRSLFLAAERCWLKKLPEHYMECNAYAYKILASLIKNESKYRSSASYAGIAEAISYLHSHYLDPDFRIEHLISKVKVSPRYFEMLFAEQFKMTPKEYVLYRKIELAKELLQGERNTVTEIAAQLGFSDVYHFSKTFKAKIGCSPTKYKER